MIALAIAAISSLVLFAVSTDDGVGFALGSAWRGAAATIGVWALARELDPDHPSSAALAAGLSIPAWMVFGIPDLLATFALVMIGRVLLRPSGHAPLLFDTLLVVGLGVAVGRTSPGWILGLTLAFAVSRDRSLPGESSRYERLAALVIAGGTTAMATRFPDSTSTIEGLVPMLDTRLTTLAAGLMVGLGLLAATTSPAYQPISLGDVSKTPLIGKRQQSARRVTLIGALLAVAVTQLPGIVATAPLWIAWIGIALVARRIVPLALGPDQPR